MGWAPIVAVDRLSEMEMSIQAAGRADFLVYPRPTFDRTTAAPIVYLEPDINGNGQALGYDMFSEEVRRAAWNER